MISIIENIGIALIVSGVLSLAIYYLFSQLIGRIFGMVHYIGLGVLFLLLTYQSYRLVCALNEKTAIEKTLDNVNNWTDDAIDFVDELARQNGGMRNAGKQIKDAMNNPLMQKGLNLFGVNVSGGEKMTIEMGETLKTKYNWYMVRRICWMLGFILIYGIFAILIPKSDTTNVNRPMHSANRSSLRPSSRNNGYHYRRR